MAELKTKYSEQNYYAKFENDAANIPTDFKGLGYYSRTSVADIVNSFIIAYIGEDKALTKVPKFEIEFWAQRGLQEFSYDTLHSEKAIEIELGDAGQVALPQDYVNCSKITVTTADGVQKLLLPYTKTGNPTAPSQDSAGDFIYDSDGKANLSDSSVTIARYQAARADSINASDYYNSNYNEENFTYYNNRFGLNPADSSTGGTYFIDTVSGVIFFDSSVKGITGSVVTLHYISDGLAASDDLNLIYVPKLAEDAMYAYILYNLAKVRPSVGQMISLYKKEASAKLRNTKIRLSNYKSEEMAQVLRGKSKWIKH
jgi:hypothetical protein